MKQTKKILKNIKNKVYFINFSKMFNFMTNNFISIKNVGGSYIDILQCINLKFS
jgi:hypothetical protein